MTAPIPLSVVLPVCNGERYVGETIASVLSQSYRDFEFLIIDDGSTDRTPEILQDFAQRDDRVRVLRQENRGVGHTIQRGLVEARGRLIAQIGADDLALPGRLEKQVRFLEDNPDHVLVGSFLQIIDSEGRPIGVRTYPLEDRRIRSKLLLYNPVGSPAYTYRRGDALAAGGFTTRFPTCEDYDFVLRLAKRGKIANLAEALTAYRFHPSSTKSTQTRRQLRDTVDTKRAACREYGYRDTPASRAVNLVQLWMTRLPAGLIYWLFKRIFVTPASQQR